MISTLSQIVPALLGLIWLTALGSDPTAPCGPKATEPAVTIPEHLRAIANHTRAIAVRIAKKTGANGS
ncbi:hypothetical protein AB0D04_01975 [Streptomyces sp. NPDC048483]|uniref:hypothetical protein n=1 Tax=Streptomyces sp. NPDC048483 TaxID=3154927 RepID=UPI0034340ABF